MFSWLLFDFLKVAACVKLDLHDVWIHDLEDCVEIQHAVIFVERFVVWIELKFDLLRDNGVDAVFD